MNTVENCLRYSIIIFLMKTFNKTKKIFDLDIVRFR